MQELKKQREKRNILLGLGDVINEKVKNSVNFTKVDYEESSCKSSIEGSEKSEDEFEPLSFPTTIQSSPR